MSNFNVNVEATFTYPLPFCIQPLRVFGDRYAQQLELSLVYLRSIGAARFNSAGTIIAAGPFKKPVTDAEAQGSEHEAFETWNKPHLEKRELQDGISCAISQWALEFSEFLPDDGFLAKPIQHSVTQ